MWAIGRIYAIDAQISWLDDLFIDTSFNNNDNDNNNNNNNNLREWNADVKIHDELIDLWKTLKLDIRK